MQTLFNGESGAFAYLLFILLYMPCVATVGVIYKEIGAFWAVFFSILVFCCCLQRRCDRLSGGQLFSAAPGLAALSLSVTDYRRISFLLCTGSVGQKTVQSGTDSP